MIRKSRIKGQHMNERETLEPCPFCGGAAGVLKSAEERGPQWRVWCLRPSGVCGLIGPFKQTEAEAIAAWNRRPDQSEIRRKVMEEIEAAFRDVTRRTCSNDADAFVMGGPAEICRRFMGAIRALATKEK